jgi:hypothetical protein
MKDAGLQMVTSETCRTWLAFDRLPREGEKAFTSIQAFLDLSNTVLPR